AIDWGFVAVAAMAGLAVNRRARHNRQLQGELAESHSERELHVAEAVARERATIARELHDIVAHSVSLMVVQAGTARPLPDLLDRVRQAGLVVELDLDADLEPPASIGLAVYRIIQEGLTNALRHTTGGRTRVVVARVRGGVEVRVESTGGRPTGHSDGSG